MRSYSLLFLLIAVAAGLVAVRSFAERRTAEPAETQRLRIYPSVEACQAEQNADDCARAFDGATRAHETSAPRYDSRESCEEIYGPAACRPYADAGGSWFIPAMAGFVLGRLLDSPSVVYEPVYVDRRGEVFWHRQDLGLFRSDCTLRPADSSCSGGGGFGGGGYVYNSSPERGRGSGGPWTNSAYHAETVPASVGRGGFGSSASWLSKPLSSGGSSTTSPVINAASVSRGGFGSTASAMAANGGIGG
jgi:uncharacterized protein YgiB involved in biofilm formation